MIKRCKMSGKADNTPQLHMHQVTLIQFIDKTHELCQAAVKIDWDTLERDLSDYYCVDNSRLCPDIPSCLCSGVKINMDTV